MLACCSIYLKPSKWDCNREDLNSFTILINLLTNTWTWWKTINNERNRFNCKQKMKQKIIAILLEIINLNQQKTNNFIGAK